MGFSDKSCREFVEVLASKEPVPGGGGAAALAGALAAALANMIGSLTVGKKRYAAVEEDIKDLMRKMTKIQDDFLALIERDAEAFKPLAKAYSMPTETEEQIAEKEHVMQHVLWEACQVPMEIMEKCCEAMEMIREFAEKGSKMVLSDAGVAATVCKAALQGASLNVYVNTKSMKDQLQAGVLNAKADAMLVKYSSLADSIYFDIMCRLK